MSAVRTAAGWDCHAHLFGPYDRFPLASERSYTSPSTAPREKGRSWPRRAKLNDLDPYAYIREVLERLPKQPASRIGELLPHRSKPSPSDDGYSRG